MDTNNTEPSEVMLLDYVKGKLSDVENICVENWINASPENEKAALQIASIYYAKRRFDRITARDSEMAYMKFQRQIRTRRLRRITAVAASVALFVFSALMIYNVLDKENVEYALIKSEIGKDKKHVLPDGTVVYLNTNTELSYSSENNKAIRHVQLDGEAYFEVFHDKSRPFIVSTNNKTLEIEVTGTAFNVQAYSSDSIIQTVLIEGSVNLKVEKDGAESIVAMTPRDKTIFNKNSGELERRKLQNTDEESAWTSNSLIFNDTSLYEVMRILSHYYNVEFVLRDESLKNELLTGEFQDKTLIQVLDYMDITSGIRYSIAHKDSTVSEGKDVITLRKRK